MSKMTTDAGPPRARGVCEIMRARVKAVATSPSASMRSAVPVGKYGSTRVKEPTKSLGREYMMDICSKITPADQHGTCLGIAGSEETAAGGPLAILLTGIVEGC